jgi:Sulfotransferase domain
MMAEVESINRTNAAHEVVRLPTVQLIGAQKAGTSAIADWLFEHGGFRRPQVFDKEPWYYSKEVHFFDSWYRYKQGPEFYSKRFARHGAGSVADDENVVADRTLDATPDTLPFAQRVRATYDSAGGEQANSVKIIVILREPVCRELSLYNHLSFDCRRLGSKDINSCWHNQVIKQDNTIMSFDEFVINRSIPALTGQETEIGCSTRHGLYATHLRQWFELFDREQILVLSYNQLEHQPERLQERVQSFLGYAIPGGLRRANANDSPFKVQKPTFEAQQALQALFTPLNEELYELLASNPGPSMEQAPFPKFEE